MNKGPYAEGVGGVGCERIPLAGQIISNSSSFFFFFKKTCVYIPNFGLKIGIFLRFAPSL